ncbi:MAG: zinc ABC transporter substrate-binding protein [Mariprofundales bacterium]|nr:zinc ABC transporter substrate-binding protein [Mariprofundales bacterium]
MNRHLSRLSLLLIAPLLLMHPALSLAGSPMVVTLPPLGGMVQLLLPDDHPLCLLSSSGDPHHLTISPRQVEQMRAAPVLVRSSGDDGGWSGLNTRHGVVVDLWSSTHHPWLVPSDVVAQLPRLAAGLQRLRLLSMEGAQRRLSLLARQMRRLDGEWRRVLQPLMRRGVIMQHPAWQRLFAHYGVPVRAVLERSHHGDGAAPHQLEEALQLLRSADPPLLIMERSHSNKMIEWLLQRVDGAEAVTLDALGVCGQPLDELMADNMAELQQIGTP